MPNRDYTQNLKIKVETDKTSLDDLASTLNNLEDLKLHVSDQTLNNIRASFNNLRLDEVLEEDTLKDVQERYEKIQVLNENIAKTQQQINFLREVGLDSDNRDLKTLRERLSLMQQEKNAITNNSSSEGDGGEEKGDDGSILKQMTLGFFKGMGNDLMQGMGLIGGTFQEKLVNVAKKAGQEVVDFFKDEFKEAIEEVTTLVQYSLNDYAHFNQSVQSQQVYYGLSSAENYALTSAYQQMGFSSMDDLLDNLWLMTDEQREYLGERIEYYEDWYEQLEDEGFYSKWAEFSESWENFKIEFEYQIMEWFIKNADSIESLLDNIMDIVGVVFDILDVLSPAFTIIIEALDLIVDVVKVVVNIIQPIFELMEYAMNQTSEVLGGIFTCVEYIVDGINSIFSFLTHSEEEGYQETSDILNSYLITNGGSSSSTTVSINNTFNGGVENQQELVNAGNLTYQQVIEALK